MVYAINSNQNILIMNRRDRAKYCFAIASFDLSWPWKAMEITCWILWYDQTEERLTWYSCNQLSAVVAVVRGCVVEDVILDDFALYLHNYYYLFRRPLHGQMFMQKISQLVVSKQVLVVVWATTVTMSNLSEQLLDILSFIVVLWRNH